MPSRVGGRMVAVPVKGGALCSLGSLCEDRYPWCDSAGEYGESLFVSRLSAL
jgi:hypothetical protein